MSVSIAWPACNSVVRIVVHQQFFDLTSSFFNKAPFCTRFFSSLVEIHVYLRCSLNFDGLLHDGVFAVQSFGQVGNSRYGGLRVQFVGLWERDRDSGSRPPRCICRMTDSLTIPFRHALLSRNDRISTDPLP